MLIRLSYKKTCKFYLQRRSKYFPCKQNCEVCFLFICVNWCQKQNVKIAYCSLKNMNGTGRITFRSQELQFVSNKTIMLINEWSNGNRKPIRHKRWNETTTIWYNRNMESGSKVHAYLYSTFLLSFKVTHLLSEGLRSELQLLPILETGKFHAPTLPVDEWRFGKTVTRHIQPKPGHSNARVYCKKNLQNIERIDSRSHYPDFYGQPFPSYESF